MFHFRILVALSIHSDFNFITFAFAFGSQCASESISFEKRMITLARLHLTATLYLCLCYYLFRFCFSSSEIYKTSLPEKCSYSDFFWSVFSRILTEYGQRYSASLRIQSKCWKIRTRKTLNTDTFYSVGACNYIIFDANNGMGEAQIGGFPKIKRITKRSITL